MRVDTAGDTLTETRLDFVTPLAVDDCVRALRHGAHRAVGLRLAVHAQGRRVHVVAGGPGAARGQVSAWWLFRFSGELIPTGAGTRVHGTIERNMLLETVLLLTGLVIGVFFAACAAFAAAEPGEGGFTALLAAIFLLLFAAYYAAYRRRLARQRRDVLRGVYEWLVLPRSG